MSTEFDFDTDRLKRDNPIAEVVTRCGVHLRKQGRSLVGLCPFHKETQPSFSVSPESGLWHCFGCGRGGDVISFVMEKENVDFAEACRMLGGGQLPALPRPLPKDWTHMAEPRPPRQLDRREAEALDLAARVYHTTLVVGPKGPDSPYGYLLGRALTVETIQEFQIGYCAGDALLPALQYVRADPAHAESVGLLRRRDGQVWEIFAGRITFVERDRDGRLIHVAGRAFARESRAKYLFLPDLPKPVYGLARARPSRPTFVVEGIVDRITLWQWGYQAVAMLGTSVKTPDARRLARGEDVYYVADNNPAGLIAAARWREAVGHGTVLQIPQEADDVNALAQQPGGEETFHRLVEAGPRPVYGLPLPEPERRPTFVVRSLYDCAQLWEWGHQAVAVMDLPPERHAGELEQRNPVYVLGGDETANAVVERWRQAVGQGEALRLPGDAKNVVELHRTPDGGEMFRRLAESHR
jgi:DNA primase